jgi:hypothetical protein
MRSFAILAALLMIAAPAEACRVPNDPEAARLQRQRQHQESAARADVIVQGRLFERADRCEPNRYCGDWIQPVRVLKGAPASYYLIDREELLLVCSREYVKPGKIGTFHLQAKPSGTYLILDDIR